MKRQQEASPEEVKNDKKKAASSRVVFAREETPAAEVVEAMVTPPKAGAKKLSSESPLSAKGFYEVLSVCLICVCDCLLVGGVSSRQSLPQGDGVQAGVPRQVGGLRCGGCDMGATFRAR